MANAPSTTKLREITEAIKFIEELVWMLESKRTLSGLKPLLDILHNTRNELVHGHAPMHTFKSAARDYVSNDPNKHLLVGILPRLLQNTALFPSNFDIASFAEEVLNLSVPRSEKRSRYELIGLVICEVNELSENKLTILVRKLMALVSNERNIDLLVEEKKNKYFSWNETIRRLTE